MRSLKKLLETESHVWLACEDKDLSVRFLKQAEDEGFICLNGQKPTELFPSRFFGISKSLKLGYVSAMVWFLSAQHPGHALDVETSQHLDPIRIDYGKYIAGREDYVIQIPRS